LAGLTRDEVIAALTAHGNEWKLFWVDFPEQVESELTGLEEQGEIEPVGGNLKQAIVAKAFKDYCESDTRAMDFTETIGAVIDEMTACKEQQEKCYCEVALKDGYNCGLGEWRPADPKAFQQSIVKKVDRALMEDWGPDRSGNLCLPDLILCPAEALWIVQALKDNKSVGPRPSGSVQTSKHT